jgi:hypothetical protein
MIMSLNKGCVLCRVVVQALALEVQGEVHGLDGDQASSNHEERAEVRMVVWKVLLDLTGNFVKVLAFFEITVASVDQPKLLSRLSEALVRLFISLRFSSSE